MRLRLSTTALALGLALARVVSAQATAGGVELVVADSCVRVDRVQLGRLLDIEQRRDVEREVQQARVSVSCDHDLVTLQVEERGAASLPRARTFAASDVSGDVGARVLSLATIELLQAPPAAAAEVKTPPVSSAPAPPPAPPASPVRPAPAPSVRLMAVGTLRSFSLERPLWGGGLAFDYVRLPPFGVRLEFDVAVADRNYEWGSTHLQLTTVSAQAGYLALHDAWSARALLGYRFGSGRITGDSAPAPLVRVGTVSGACGGPLVSGGLGLRSGSWLAELSAEAGLVSFPLEGTVTGHDSIGFQGYWLGLSVNVGALL